MAAKLRDTMTLVKTYLNASERFAGASIGEPKAAPQTPHAAVVLDNNRVTGTTLKGTIEERVLRIRIYVIGTEEPNEDIEFLLDDTVSEVIEDLLGDFDLGDTVRCIEPTSITTKYGYLTIGQALYRIADIMLPLVVDDSAVFSK